MKGTDEFVPYTLSIKKLCEKTDKLQYFNQIRNRILRELVQDESLVDFVRFNANNLNDVYLDNDGVLMFSEILIGYFEEEIIKGLWMNIRNLNKFRKNEYDLQHMFDNFSIPDLLKLIKEAERYNPEEKNLKDAKQTVINQAHAELKKRSIIAWGKAVGVVAIKNILK